MSWMTALYVICAVAVAAQNWFMQHLYAEELRAAIKPLRQQQ